MATALTIPSGIKNLDISIKANDQAKASWTVRWVKLMGKAYSGPYLFVKTLQKTTAFAIEYFNKYRPQNEYLDSLKQVDRMLARSWQGAGILAYAFVAGDSALQSVKGLAGATKRKWLEVGIKWIEFTSTMGYAAALFTDCAKRTAVYTGQILSKAGILSAVHDVAELGLAVHDYRQIGQAIGKIPQENQDEDHSHLRNLLKQTRFLHMLGIAGGVAALAGFIFGVTTFGVTYPLLAAGVALAGVYAKMIKTVYETGMQYEPAKVIV